MDLGACPKTHSERILKQFKEAQEATPNDPRILQFKQEHEANIYQYVEECDRRIRASQRKLEKTPEENRKTIDLMKEIGEIELSIQNGTEEIEKLGEAGKIEESMERLEAVEALKQLKTDKEKELKILDENAGASGHQKLRVCEICGAMLSVLDSDKRLADHFGGKMHLGFHELRKLMSQWAEERMRGPPRTGPPPSAAPPPGPPPGRVPPFPISSHPDDPKREAGEVAEDPRDRGPAMRYDDRPPAGGDRYGDRSDRYGDRERRDRYGGSSRYDDRDRERDRYGASSSSRYDDRDRDRGHERRRSRSRSPSKRRVV